MNKKLWILGTALIIIMLVLSACQPAAPAAEEPAAEEPAAEEPAAEEPVAEEPAAEEMDDGPFKVALLLPGSANDQSWNQLAYDGVMAAKDNLGNDGNKQRGFFAAGKYAGACHHSRADAPA